MYINASRHQYDSELEKIAGKDCWILITYKAARDIRCWVRVISKDEDFCTINRMKVYWYYGDDREKIDFTDSDLTRVRKMYYDDMIISEPVDIISTEELIELSRV